MKLSKKQIKELLPKLEAEARKVLVFESLKYVDTLEFNVPRLSVYHVFGAYNVYYNCTQKVTYCPTSKSIQFGIHTISFEG